MTDPRRHVRRKAASRRERGVALLLALLVVSVVTTLAAGMVWQQWRHVQTESAERARMQATWILAGAVDWARLILREDALAGSIDHLGEPWAVPLQEARLSTFLSGGREEAGDNPALQAFLSGSIQDAQSRLNLRNLAAEGPGDGPTARALVRICEAAGVPPDTASRLREGAARSWTRPGATAATGADPWVGPRHLSELSWWGLSPVVIEQLRPWVVILPNPTPLNVNTATPEVLAAAIEGLGRAGAERLVQARAQAPFRRMEQVTPLLPPRQPSEVGLNLGLASSHFEVEGRLRMGGRVVSERVLVERRQQEMVVIQRERLATTTP